jgi:hypothetical protein
LPPIPHEVSSPSIEIEAGHETTSLDDFDPEIDQAISQIGMSSEKPPTDEGTFIGERPASYIPNSMFEEAGGVGVNTEASLTEKETSSPSINDRRIAIIRELRKKLGIKHLPRIEKVHIAILEAAKTFYVQDTPIEDEDMLRKVLLLMLCNMDPKSYSPNDPIVMKRNNAALARALIAELKKRKKYKLAAKLEKDYSHLSGQHKAVKS